MAKNSSVNLDITPNADGYSIAGGTTPRTLTLTAGNVTLSAGGSNTYTLPAATGTLVSRDSTDTLTNKTASGSTNTFASDSFSVPYKYSAYKSSATQTINTGSATKITFDAEEFDTGSNFASSTFTAPIAGFYYIGSTIGYNAVGSGQRVVLSIYKNGSLFKRGGDQFTNALAGSVSVSALVQLSASDTIDIYAQPVGANTVITNTQEITYTYGYLVSRI